MNRKMIVVTGFTAILVATGLFCTAAHAKTVKAVTVQKSLSEAQKKDVEIKAREILKGKEWIIYLHNRDGGKGVETDSLVFTDETVNSANLAARGYPVSNFGMFVNNDGSVSWETMKTNPENKNKAFLRGELKMNAMTGTVFMKPVKGATSTYIFSTVNPATIAVLPETALPEKKAEKSRK